MNLLDRFLYKLIFMSFILLSVVTLDKFDVISISLVKEIIGYNINITKTISILNGKVELIDLGDDTISVSFNQKSYEDITNGKRIISSSNVVLNEYCGSVVKIIKNDNLYDVYVLTNSDVIYCYSKLTDININLYQIVKRGEEIGRTNYDTNNYYELYLLDKSGKFITN